jgi:hypothetical protein
MGEHSLVLPVSMLRNEPIQKEARFKKISSALSAVLKEAMGSCATAAMRFVRGST